MKEKTGDFLSINFMAKNGVNFVWPTIPDIQIIEKKGIFMKIETPPFPVSSRHFGMDNQTFTELKLFIISLSSNVVNNIS